MHKCHTILNQWSMMISNLTIQYNIVYFQHRTQYYIITTIFTQHWASRKKGNAFVSYTKPMSYSYWVSPLPLHECKLIHLKVAWREYRIYHMVQYMEINLFPGSKGCLLKMIQFHEFAPAANKKQHNFKEAPTNLN